MRLHQFTMIFFLMAFSFIVVYEMKSSMEESLAQERRKLEQCISEAVKQAGEEFNKQTIQGVYRPEQMEDAFFFSLATGLGIEEQKDYRKRLEILIPVLCIVTEEGYDIGSYMETGSEEFRRSWNKKRIIDKKQRIRNLETEINLILSELSEKQNNPEAWRLDLPKDGENEWVKVIENPCFLAIYLRNAYGQNKVICSFYGAALYESGFLHIIEHEGRLTWHYEDCQLLTEHYQKYGKNKQICFPSVKECIGYGAHASDCCEFLIKERSKQ